ncbi:MAG: toxin [Deltaproteobacteria bacterium]|nr:toxin [Deltaproteobacteria bacterium]
MILWDDAKNLKLQLERKISFEEITAIILRKEYVDILENPSYPEQAIFVIRFNEYIWAVPFLVDQEGDIILKTAYPSRKLQKRYGASHE